MKRQTIVRPGYDCRTECKHEPQGDHGICGDEWIYVVSDGESALVYSVLSDHYPAGVDREALPAVLLRGIGGPMAIHRPGKGHDAMACQYIDGGWCSIETIGYLCGMNFWKEHGDPKQSEQSEAFWQALEADFHTYKEPG